MALPTSQSQSTSASMSPLHPHHDHENDNPGMNYGAQLDHHYHRQPLNDDTNENHHDHGINNNDTHPLTSSNAIQLHHHDGDGDAEITATSSSSVSLSDDTMNELVLSYLNKRGYMRAAEQLRNELQYKKELHTHAHTQRGTTDTHTPTQPPNPLTQTEIGELALDLGLDVHTHLLKQIVSYNVQSHSPHDMIYQYSALKQWIDQSMDLYRYELQALLWPLYVHIYLDLIHYGFISEAHRFLQRYRIDHEVQHHMELQQFISIMSDQHIRTSELCQYFLRRKVEILLSAFSHQLLVSYIEERNFLYLLKIINTHLHMKIISRKPLKSEANDINTQIQHSVGVYTQSVPRQLKLPSSTSTTSASAPSGSQRTATTGTAVNNLLSEQQRMRQAVDSTVNVNQLNKIPVKWGVLQDVSDLYIQARAKLANQRLDELHRQREKNVEEKAILQREYAILQSLNADDENGNVNEAGAAATSGSTRKRKAMDGDDGEGKRGAGGRGGVKTSISAREKERKDAESRIKEIEDKYRAEEQRIQQYIDSVIPLPTTIVSREEVGMPLPELTHEDRHEFIENLHQRMRVSSHHLPSLCIYTFLNSQRSLTNIVIDKNGRYIGGCYADSTARLWDMNQTVQHARDDALEDEVDRRMIDADNNNNNTLDSKQTNNSLEESYVASPYWLMTGHSSAVYTADFSPDSQYVLTGSEDSHIRLWHIPTRTNVVVYKGHNYPVWSVKFSSLGFYFASGSHDRTARLWSTDKTYPLRILVGHLSDVEVVEFHPNSNYLLTGSADTTVRMWDIQTGDCVRIFTGKHTSAVCSIACSPDGQYLVSGGEDGKVILWDIANGTIVDEWSSDSLKLPELDISTAAITGKLPESSGAVAHTRTITSLTYSNDGNIIASASLDGTIKLWNPHRRNKSALIKTFKTNATPVTTLRFTPRNVLLAAGIFSPNI